MSIILSYFLRMKMTSVTQARFPAGVGSALLAALLFGASTPMAKVLLGEVPPILLASIFYLASGIALSLFLFIRPRSDRTEARLARRDIPWLAASLFFGGVLGPVLMMAGLRATSSSTASLLLNLESVFTALLAWFVFHENVDRRIAFGMALILCGSALLTFRGESDLSISPGAILIAAACLCWGIDNNVTQKVSARDPIQIAALKGLVAGSVNLSIAFALGAAVPSVGHVSGAVCVGVVGYGCSLVFFVSALRRIGTARTSAYFSLAPFIGLLLSFVILGDALRGFTIAGGMLMLAGVWLLLTERHAHEHTHEHDTHTHLHEHDEHHRHAHDDGQSADAVHTHDHVHDRLTHTHRHYPDIHHRHDH